MVIYTAINPVIEINKDGTRAKAVWLSPGIINFPIDAKGTIAAARCWGKKENLKPGHVVVRPDLPSDPSFHVPYRTDKVNRFDPPPPGPYKD